MIESKVARITAPAEISFIIPIFLLKLGSTKSQIFSMAVLIVSAIKTKKQTKRISAASVEFNLKYTIKNKLIIRAKTSN